MLEESAGLEVLVGIIGSTGFPIAIAWFLLTRVEKAVNNIGTKLEELTNELRAERFSRVN